MTPGMLKQRRDPMGEVAVENQERQPDEMIAMQMRHHHRIDRARVQPPAL
jgi:hypothetical protein